MTAPLKLVLLIFAFVCFALSAWKKPPDYQINLIAAGLAFWVASLIF